MQSVSSRIWTRIAVFISYGDNDYTTGTWWVAVRVGDGDKRDVVGKATSGRRGLGAPDELQLEIGRSYRRDVVRKATSGRRGLGALMSWGPGKLLIRCSKESQHPAEWASGPPVEHLEDEKDTTLTAIRVGVKILQFMFGLQLPLTRKPWITFSNLCNKVRRTYFVKEVFLRASLLFCRYDAAYENITNRDLVPVPAAFFKDSERT